MLNPASVERTTPANDAVNLIALFNQKFGQVASILTCYSSDEGNLTPGIAIFKSHV